MQDKYKTNVSDIQPMKANSVRLHSTVGTIKYLMDKYDTDSYKTIGRLLELIQLECNEMDDKICDNFELRK